MKNLVFDMDGTIVDLFHVDSWCEKLNSGDFTPYTEAAAIYDEKKLNTVLNKLKSNGYRIIVVSWNIKGYPQKEAQKDIRKRKIKWLLKKDFPIDELHIVKYGTNKFDVIRKKHGKELCILIDDNKNVRMQWEKSGNASINAKQDIIPQLEKLLIA